MTARRAVAIPHRDALLACPLGNPGSLRLLRERAAAESARSRYAITRDPLICEPGGRVLWRLTEQWPYRGKDLHEFLHTELRRRYGDRLGSFGTDLAAAPWWFWAPDL